MPLVQDQQPVQAFAADAGDPAFTTSIAFGARTGVRITSMPSARNTASNRAGSLSPDRGLRSAA